MVGGQAPQENDDARQQAASSQDAETETIPLGSLAGEVPADIRDVSFASSVRGYDRREVDAYVKRVNRIIAELEVSRSPQSAVKHALDRVGEQTSGVLQRAREVADELTATALTEADHATRRAKVEAEETVESAQMQAHQLRGQAKEEADEILARASSEGAKRLKHAEEQARRLQGEAEERLRALRAEIEAAAGARRDLFEELRRTAAGLEEFARTTIAGADDVQQGEQQDPPTERMPKQTPRSAAPRSRQGGARERVEASSGRDAGS